MFISFFLAITTPMIFGAAWVAELYYRELEWQRTQIVLDNTAIRLGQSDLNLVQELERDRKEITNLHQKYHKSLACSLVPPAAIGCGKLAKALRASIRGLNLISGFKAKKSWARGTSIAERELGLTTPNLHLKRAPGLSLKQNHCPACSEVNGLTLTNLTQAQSRLFEPGGRSLSVSVSIVNEAPTKWDYRLWAK
jgi:hypothetical protein